MQVGDRCLPGVEVGVQAAGDFPGFAVIGGTLRGSLAGNRGDFGALIVW